MTNVDLHDSSILQSDAVEVAKQSSGSDELLNPASISGNEVDATDSSDDIPMALDDPRLISGDSDKEVVRHKIVKVVLDNFQSWVKDSGPLEFKEDVLNMIKARNETGKSVMFKVFKQMCYPGKGGNLARLDLLRRFCRTATATIYMSDGYIIRFVIDRPDMTKQTTAQYYELIDPNGHTQRFFGTYLPEPIREVLGWYVDPKQEILLNLIEKDGPQLFINTSGSFNANALKFITENPVVTEALRTMGEWDSTCSNAMESLARLHSNLQGRIASLQYTNISDLMVQNAAIELILPLWTSADSASMRYDVCNNILQRKPVMPDCDFETADLMHDIYTYCTDIENAVGQAERVLDLKPEDICVDWDAANSLYEVAQVLDELDFAYKDARDVLEARPKSVGDLNFEQCEQISNIYVDLNALIRAFAPVVHLNSNRPHCDVTDKEILQADKLAEIINVVGKTAHSVETFVQVYKERPKYPGDIGDATKVVDLVHSIEASYNNLKKLAVNLNDRQIAMKRVTVTEAELDKLFKQLDVCPVCGSQIKPGTHAHLGA